MCTASSQLLLICFPTYFSPYMNIMDIRWSILLKIFSIFLTFYFAEKSLKFSKYKNIQESGNCSQLTLLLNNNNKCIDEKYICYAKYCYKMKIFNILGYGGSPGPKWHVKQLSSMHKRTTLKDISQPLNFIKINI